MSQIIIEKLGEDEWVCWSNDFGFYGNRGKGDGPFAAFRAWSANNYWRKVERDKAKERAEHEARMRRYAGVPWWKRIWLP